MGYSAYNNLGAYIEMPKVEQTYTKTIRRCSDENCVNHKNLNMSADSHFCNKCGSEIEESEVKSTKSAIINYYNFAQEHGFDPEEFTQVQDSKILIPNRSFGTTAHWDDNEEIVKEFDWGTSRRDIVDFKASAQEFMDKFKEIYGVELEVKYGVVSYIL